MKIGVFAGTTEGRLILDYLSKSDAEVDAFVATEQGEFFINQYSNKINILVGRIDEEKMENVFVENKYDLIIDATHPYADIASLNIKTACNKLNIEYLRVVRNLDYNGNIFENTDEVVEYLNNNDGNILLTTGSKDLKKFTLINNYKSRVYVRILPVISSIEECINNGYDMNHIIGMVGPFSKEINVSLINNYHINYVVSKLGGKSGGFDEKVLACEETNTTLLVIDKKDENIGLEINDAISYLSNKVHINKIVNIVGIGPGCTNYLTKEALSIIDSSDVIIGAKRMVDTFNKQNKCYEYLSDKIVDFIENSNFTNYAVLFSGDVGFYSGCKKLLELLSIYEVNIYPGISSLVYLCSKVGLSYEDIKFTSLHGRSNNIISYINKNKYVFSLVNPNGINDLINKLMEYDLGETKLYIGEDLSYESEKIVIDYAKNLVSYNSNALACVIIENNDYSNKVTYGYKDEEFFKDKSPMTKMEVRSVSISKLELNKDSICYDVGAGTGSVSIEMANLCCDGKVYAIEKDADAIESLKENKKRFRTDNLEIIEGIAPEVLAGLERPTHAFIGGSSGNLDEIIEVLLKKNEDVKIVLNAISLETINEAYNVFKKYNLDMDVSCINVSRNKVLGSYNLMMGQNPIYIFTRK